MVLKASVLICLNKFDQYTKPSIDSILTQDFSNFEFIIVANNCTDEDFLSIQKCSNDKSIRFF